MRSNTHLRDNTHLNNTNRSPRMPLVSRTPEASCCATAYSQALMYPVRRELKRSELTLRAISSDSMICLVTSALPFRLHDHSVALSDTRGRLYRYQRPRSVPHPGGRH